MHSSKLKQFLSATLAIAMVVTSSPVTSFAAAQETKKAQATDITAESSVTDITAEKPAKDTKKSESKQTENISITEEAKTDKTEPAAPAEAAETKTLTEATETKASAEAETKEQAWKDAFAESQSSFNESGMDFSSGRLVLGTDNSSLIIDGENILSEYEGLYLLQYGNEADAKLAYGYYLDKADFVEPDAPVQVAEGSEGSDAIEMTEEQNPIAELASALEDTSITPRGKVIALLDSGVSEDSSVADRVSMVGDDVNDNYGHGNNMMTFIKEENPSAKVLSVKVIDDNGRGSISSVYAGVKYAIEQNVDVINLSLYAKNTAENAALKDVVKEAVNAGITVVGAAGNDGKDVKYYTPGNIDEAMIVGAADENGQRIASSNFGSTVDYNVLAGSTSEASAKMSAYMLANDGVVDVADVNMGKIFATDYEGSEAEIVETNIDVDNSEENSLLMNVPVLINGTTPVEMDVYVERTDGESDEVYQERVDYVASAAKNGKIYVYSEEDETDTLFKAAATEKGKIGAGAAITYGGAGTGVVSTDTRKFPFTVGDKTYIAFCCDPNHQPLTFAGDQVFTAKEITNGKQKRALFFTSEGPGWDTIKLPFAGPNKTMKEYYQDNLEGKAPSGYEWNEVVFTHLIVSKIFEDNSRRKEWTDGIEGGTFATLRNAVTAAASAIESASNPNGFDNYKVFMLDEDNYQRHVYGHGAFIRAYKKNESDAPLSGAVFTLKKGNKTETTLTSGSDGYTEWYCIEDDEDYTLQETTAPAGYQVSDKIDDINLKDGKASTKTFTDKPSEVWVYLEKRCNQNYTSLIKDNSNYSLQGAVYGVYADSACTQEKATLTTDANGNAPAVKLDSGANGSITYYVKEKTAPKGFKMDTAVHSVTLTTAANSTPATAAKVAVTDIPVYAINGIEVRKVNNADKLLEKVSPDDNPLTYHMTFNTGVAPIKEWNVSSDVGIIKMAKGSSWKDANGNAVFPLGSFTFQETMAPNGYEIDKTVYTGTVTQSGNDAVVTITNGGNYSNTGNVFKMENSKNQPKGFHKDEAIFAGVSIQKADIQTKKRTPQGDAELSGITFEVWRTGEGTSYYDKSCSVPVDMTKPVATIVTDKNGIAKTANNALQVEFDYIIKEVGTNNSYLLTDFSEHDVRALTKDDEGKIVPAIDEDIENRVVRGGFEAYKVDKETMISYALGGAKLDGIDFELVNKSKNEVYVENDKYPEGHLYQPGEPIDTPDGKQYFTTDERGRIFAPSDYLAFGTYELREIDSKKTNKTYMFPKEAKPNTFRITEEGVIVGETEGRVIKTKEQADGTLLVFPDPVVRSDYKFQKKDENGRPMANIPFVIENLKTHEKHYIMTDANGAYNSRTDNSSYSDGQDTSYQNYVPHTMNTNAYDEILSQYDGFEEDGKTEKVIPADVIQQLAEKYDYRVGTWFGLSQDVLEEGNEGTMADPDDALGAFPYGSYTIKELKTEKNANKMRPSYPMTVYQNNHLIEGGTLDNEPITISTTAVDKNIGKENHKGSSKTNATIIDKIDYTGLDTEGTYKFVAELHYSKELEDGTFVDGGIVTDADGNEVRIEGKRFNPPSRDNHTKVELQLNSTSLTVNGEEIETGRTVVFEYLYQIIEGEDGEEIEIPVASHEDPEDEAQIIEYPSITTTAVGNDTGLHMTYATATTSITDRVYYKGLEPGKQYEVTGTLMDKETGEEVKGADGKAVQTVEKKTANDEGDGYWDIVFTFDAVPYAGKSIVTFERVTTDGTDVAVHADINDDDQTVIIPRITTEAKDGDTLCHVGKSSDPVFYDTMKYYNLIPGYTYVAQGSLVDKDSGKELDITSEPYEFTPEEPDGEIELMFNLGGHDLQGTTLVAMEECYLKAGQGADPFNPDSEEPTKPDEDTLIADHKDPNDEDQSIYYPDVTTDAKDGLTADHVGTVTEKTTVTDVVTMSNLVVGETYKVKGVLMKKGDEVVETAELLDINGEKITAESDEFVAEAEEMQLELTFEVDSSLLEAVTVVAYEKLYTINPNIDTEVEVAKHEDPNDEDQSVHYPKIRTHAFDGYTGDHSGSLFGKAINAIRGLFGGDAEEDTLGEVMDVVTYENLIPGVEYTMKGTLMDKKTGEAIADAEGNPVTAEEVFTPETADGEVILSFSLDTSVLNDHTVVAFEKLFHKNADYQEGDTDEEGNPVDPEVEVARHEDLNDEEQSVHEPDIFTTAADATTGSHSGYASGKTVIDDEVVMHNLIKGYYYTLTGTLYDQSTGKPFLTKDGKQYITTVEFVADDEDPSFTEDKSAKEESKDTANEGNEDVEDAAGTEGAADTSDDAQNTDDQNVDDQNVDGQNADDTGFTTADGEQPAEGTTTEDGVVEEIPAETIERIDGTVHVRFAVDGEQLAGTTVVTFEDLYHNEVRIATHSDINDEAQSVHYPGIRTHAYDTANDAKETQANGKTTVKDLVTYKNLTPGKTYTITGQEVSKKTGKPINGATASQTFTPQTADGSIILTFTFDSSALAGDTVVAFEKLFIHDEPKDGDKTEVAHHEDINDADQSVGVIDLRTHATDKKTGTHDGIARKKAVVIDRVTYTGLTVGQKYTVKGELMNKATKKGTGIKAEKTFTAKEANGYIDLTFKFDSRKYAGKSLVAFEKLFTDVTPANGGKAVSTEIARHEDLADGDQTVNIIKISTKLVDKKTGKKTATAGSKTELVDEVTYTGLTPGKKYTVKGELMDKTTKKSTGIKASKTFTAKKANGKVKITFTVDTEKYAGKSLVAFERLYNSKKVKIAVHEDIKDKDQTIQMPGKTPKKGTSGTPGTPGTSTPGEKTMSDVKTGDTQTPFVFGGIAAIALIAVFVALKKKRAA